ncbi:MAG TPA: hypothetical protein DCP91_09355 [Eggerthellaceae bacterium]|nr:hypothetical protein [Eggerthellaceae bacterium]
MRYYDGGDAEQMALFDASKGERFREQAESWIEANPKAWAYIVSQATLSASMGRSFGMKALCEHVRWHMEVSERQEGFKLNNNYTSAFTRILCEQHPEVAPYVKTRSAAVDLCA